jgi:hypothetical protein
MKRWGVWVTPMCLAVWGTGVVLAAEGPGALPRSHSDDQVLPHVSCKRLCDEMDID